MWTDITRHADALSSDILLKTQQSKTPIHIKLSEIVASLDPSMEIVSEDGKNVLHSSYNVIGY